MRQNTFPVLLNPIIHTLGGEILARDFRAFLCVVKSHILQAVCISISNELILHIFWPFFNGIIGLFVIELYISWFVHFLWDMQHWRHSSSYECLILPLSVMLRGLSLSDITRERSSFLLVLLCAWFLPLNLWSKKNLFWYKLWDEDHT